MRKNAYAFCGGAFGDEGKGRIVDEYVDALGKKHPVVVYRDNGGANAGHTVEFSDGTRVALHQLPSGIFSKKAVVILGKGMVIHPGDLWVEIVSVRKIAGKKGVADIRIDEMATVALDTHRAYEAALKSWADGGKGATGRGIGPAYADILLRHPVRMRDIVSFDEDVLSKHYRLYKALLQGLGVDLAKVVVPVLDGTNGVEVGTEKTFLDRLKKHGVSLRPYVSDVSVFVEKTWHDENVSYVFEKAQAIGLDYRWGVYPDVTSSDTTFDGILSASEGVIDPLDISVRAGVIKATYMSSVGTRVLPTMMEEALASRIREDAFEYGATTRRPRGIAYLDLAAIRFYCHVGKINTLVLTHMDVVYQDTNVRVCVGYTKNGKPVSYRPDQQFLNSVRPVYKEFPSWDKNQLTRARTYKQLPTAAKGYLRFLAQALDTPILMITTGAKRNQSIKIPKKRSV
jgi:adenylosuccinate synthase